MKKKKFEFIGFASQLNIADKSKIKIGWMGERIFGSFATAF